MKATNLSLSEAATNFLADLPPEEREKNRQELIKFVRWYGMERRLRELAAHEVANYAERMEGSSANAMKRLEPVRAFLAYAKKEGLTETNLGVHLRLKKGAKQVAGPKVKAREKVTYSEEGYRALEEELSALKMERPKIADEIRRAAADKDFRENFPLEAAKERQGLIEARIRQLEQALRSAALATDKVDTAKVAIGSTVVVQDLASKGELRYTLVNPREANPAEGKISIASPMGQALLNRGQGEVVEVAAPGGKLHYQIQKIER